MHALDAQTQMTIKIVSLPRQVRGSRFTIRNHDALQYLGNDNSSQVFVGHTLGPIVYASRGFLLVQIRSSSSLEPFIGTGIKSFLASEAKPPVTPDFWVPPSGIYKEVSF